MKKVMLPMIEKGHLTKECKLQNKVCVHCGENKKYNRSLWPQKFGTTMKLGTERNEKKTLHTKNCNWREKSYVNCTCNG